MTEKMMAELPSGETVGPFDAEKPPTQGHRQDWARANRDAPQRDTKENVICCSTQSFYTSYYSSVNALLTISRSNDAQPSHHFVNRSDMDPKRFKFIEKVRIRGK